ncbi:MAG: hypothetical protein U9N36_06455 [Euryarchaeota archaeon]|nr:hypothetical protein [Euryarchaeota archaeon]
MGFCRCGSGFRSFPEVGAGLPKIAIAEGYFPEEANACDAPPLKLMQRVIHVATNGILNTGNAIEECV